MQSCDSGGDRYRTAAAQYNFGLFSINLNLFTGDPGLKWEDREKPEVNGRETYVMNIFDDDPDKYRAGVLSFGMGPVRFGRNTERIRHIFQNRLAHDILTNRKSPNFLRLDEINQNNPRYREDKWYFYFGTGTGNTLY